MCAPIVGIPSTLRDTISELTSNICTMERTHGGLRVSRIPFVKKGISDGRQAPWSGRSQSGSVYEYAGYPAPT